MNEPDFPVIETERLLLALPPVEAAPRMLSYFEENREHLAPWSPRMTASYYTEAYWHERLAKARVEFEQGQSMHLAIFERGPRMERVIGVCNFSSFIRGAFQACYLGYSIGYREEGRGLMHEAVSAGITYAFEQLRLHRIMANYVPTNERSGRLLRRLGFTVEGYARDYLLIAGRWQDHVMTSLTNTAWKQSDA